MLTGKNSRRSLLVVGCLAAASCSDSSGPGDGDLHVRAFARSRAAGSAAALVAPDPRSASAVTAVRVQRVLLVLGRVKLEKAADWTADFVDERSVVLTLVPDGEPADAVAADVPGGRYRELELAFDKLEVGKASEESLMQQYPGLTDASVLVEGTATVDGSERSFTFASALDLDVEVLFDPPLDFEGDTDPVLLSLVLDVGGWFRDGSGLLLDPAAPSSRSAIEGNVSRSIHLFEDREQDGR